MRAQDLRPLVLAPAAARAAVAGGTLPASCAACDSRGTGVCAILSAADLMRIAGISTPLALGKGQDLLTEGAPATTFFNITAGYAKLYKLLPDGRQQITGFAGPGHFLGLATTTSYACSAQALGPLAACRFPRARLQAVLSDVPAFEHRLLQTACRDLAEAQDRMLTLGRRTAAERVAGFLLGWEQATMPCGMLAAPSLHLPMTRTDIADYLGLTIETVSRTIGRFRQRGLIALPSPADIAILDRAGLHTEAGD